MTIYIKTFATFTVKNVFFKIILKFVVKKGFLLILVANKTAVVRYFVVEMVVMEFLR